jgi:hypothetical protein
MAAASCLIYVGFREVEIKGNVQSEILYALFVMYCLAVLSDSLIGAIIERGVWKTPPAPDTQVLAQVTTEAVNVSTATETATTTATEVVPNQIVTPQFKPDPLPTTEGE